MCSAGRRQGYWLLPVFLISAFAVSCGGVEKPSGDTLMCSPPEQLRFATVVVRQSTAREAANSAFDLSIGEVDSVVVGAEGTFLAIVAGGYVASVEPELRGDGAWDVTEVATCALPTTELTEAVIDGELDCSGSMRWSQQAMIAADASGPATPEEALVEFLAAYERDLGGRVTFHRDTVATLVVDEREVVRATAIEAPAGGWIVASASGCDLSAP